MVKPNLTQRNIVSLSVAKDELKIKRKLKAHFHKYPIGMNISMTTLSKLFNIPHSKAKQILSDLEIDGFLERIELPAEKYITRLWRLKNVNEPQMKNEFRVPQLNPA